MVLLNHSFLLFNNWTITTVYHCVVSYGALDLSYIFISVDISYAVRFYWTYYFQAVISGFFLSGDA